MAQDSENVKRKEIRIQIPIFFKLMISMLFVATIPIFLLGIVSMGGTASITASLGLQTTVILLTVITLAIVLMWSFFLASSITSPIVKLTNIAQNMSQGEIKTSEIDVMSNDEIGELVTSFNKLINTYRILDTLAKDDTGNKEIWILYSDFIYILIVRYMKSYETNSGKRRIKILITGWQGYTSLLSGIFRRGWYV